MSCETPETKNTKSVSSDKIFEDCTEMVEYTKEYITEVSTKDLQSIMNGDEEYYLVDVRTGKENAKSYIPGSVSIPRGVLEFRIANEDVWDDEGIYMPEKTSNIIIYCKKGGRGALAAQSLQQLGYSNVVSLKGGFVQWKKDFPKEIYENVIPTSSGAAPAVAAEEDSGGC
ncbi:MAG: rhodanese-like domain-containing protein [Bacteroidota bacterium]